MQSFDDKKQVEEVQQLGPIPGTNTDGQTPDNFAKDFKAAKKESRKMAKEQKKAERKEFMDPFKQKQNELKEQHKEAKQQLFEKQKEETPELNILPQEKNEQESIDAKFAFRKEKTEVSERIKNERRELNAEFKAKKQALRKEIREAKAASALFGTKILTPEQEKEKLEKKIAKLQAKFMELYGETPEADEAKEAAEDKVNDAFQIVDMNK